MTSCGNTKESTSATVHGIVSGLYFVMLIWHIGSIFTHQRRAKMAGVNDKNWLALGQLIDPKDRERWIAEIIKKHPKAAEKLRCRTQ